VWCAGVANSAAAAGGIIFFITYIPYSFLQPRYSTLSWPVKMASCLLSNVGIALGCQVIGMFEGTGMYSTGFYCLCYVFIIAFIVEIFYAQYQ